MGSHRSHRSEPVALDVMRILVDKSDTGRSHRTWVLALQNDTLYIAMIKGKIDPSRLFNSDPTVWKDVRIRPHRFSPSSLWPSAHSSYLKYSPSRGDDSSVYKKFKDPLHLCTQSDKAYRNLTEDDFHKQVSQREIEMCERLHRYPHPNIAKYKGVECAKEIAVRRSKDLELLKRFDKERVIKIIFKKYTSNLWDWVLDGKSIPSLTDCLTSIANGIKHMHSLSLVHCDIKPDNIFVEYVSSSQVRYVVGDFDSTARKGTEYELKGGTVDWGKDKGFDGAIVEENDDWYSFDLLKAWLVRRLGRRERDYSHIGGPGRVRKF